MQILTPLKAARKQCLDCSAGSTKYVAYCPCDGVNSTRCQLWPYRFGFRPENVSPSEFVTPGALPGPNVNLDDLPTPRVGRKPSRSLSPAQRRDAIERLQQARKTKAAEKKLPSA